jgi:hypothetical protein
MMSAKPLTTAELEVIRRLFFRGLTWDGYLSSRDCCTSLRDRGLAQYEFGFAWLTPEGGEIAIKELGLLRAEHMGAAEYVGPCCGSGTPCCALLNLISAAFSNSTNGARSAPR